MKRDAISGAMFVVASLLLIGCNSEQPAPIQTNSPFMQKDTQAKKRAEQFKELRRVVVELKQQVEQLRKLAETEEPVVQQAVPSRVQSATFLETDKATSAPQVEQLTKLPSLQNDSEPLPIITAEARAILKQALAVQQKRLSIIANNFANADTIAFKRSRLDIESSHYRNDVLPGALDASGNPTAVGISVGLGCRAGGVKANFEQGEFEVTNKQLDLAIEGRGFFQVLDPSGETLYTRAGNLAINANGQLVIGSAATGRLIEPAITIPPDTTDVTIDPAGQVFVRHSGTIQLTQVGTLQLAMFVNREGLLKKGKNLYAETGTSGSPTIGTTGRSGAGDIRQEMLEKSNVDPIQELLTWGETKEKIRVLLRLLEIDDLVEE